MLPAFDVYSVFYICVGSVITLLVILVGGICFRKLDLVKSLWCLTYWFVGSGIMMETLGVYYEITILQGEGLIMLVIGSGLLSLSGLIATAASKKQQEKESSKQLITLTGCIQKCSKQTSDS